MKSRTSLLSRRRFVAKTSLAVAGAVATARLSGTADSSPIAKTNGPFQAMGTRVGELTDTTAIIWARLTKNLQRNNDGAVVKQRKKGQKKAADEESQEPVLDSQVDDLEGACPGAPGRVQVRYGTREDLRNALVTDCVSALADNDFIGEFKLAGLKPGTVYHYASEVVSPGGVTKETVFSGKFETAPLPEAPSNLRFCVMTCQGYPDRGHPDGHQIYPSMLALKPQFVCLTGDLVYYDSNAPRAVTVRLARYHWERMFSLPRLVEFNQNVGGYWLKDDHDTLSNDSWPGKQAGEFTFAQGQEIFRQQAPMNDDGPAYRTVRWGRDLQIWFTDGRDFRSPNNMPDGPDKTIWGSEQKAWFKRTVKESTATWKILVSPTPLVGPDRKDKHDNHSNDSFKHEGDEIRNWIKANVPDNFFVITGDRHWQYHSVHPETGLNEFSVGAASDEHAGGTPGFNPAIHKFHRVKGGFLAVTLKREGASSHVQFELRDIHGEVVYSCSQSKKVRS